MSSLNRFEKFMPGVRTNVVDFGSTVQEFELTKGDTDPEFRPLADPRRTDGLLGLSATRSSDRLRLNDPYEVGLYDDFTGRQHTFIEIRGALKRLDSKIIQQMLHVVQAGDDQLRQRKEDSLARVMQTAEHLKRKFVPLFQQLEQGRMMNQPA